MRHGLSLRCLPSPIDTLRCSFKVLNGVACQKGERGRACTCNFSFMGLRLKFRHALKGIIPRYYRGSKSSCDHSGSPRSSRNGKCRSAEYARSRSSFTVLGRFCGSRQSRRRLRDFNSALRCSNRRDICLIVQVWLELRRVLYAAGQIRLEPLQLPPCQIVLAPRCNSSVIGHVG